MKKFLSIAAAILLLLSSPPLTSSANSQYLQPTGVTSVVPAGPTALYLISREHQYIRLQEMEANNSKPGIQDRAARAMASGVNDPEFCKPGQSGGKYVYPVNTGTNPSGPYFSRLCPQGTLVYLPFSPDQPKPRYVVEAEGDGGGGTTHGNGGAPRHPLQAALDMNSGGFDCQTKRQMVGRYNPHYGDVLLCRFICPVNVGDRRVAADFGSNFYVEYTDSRAVEQNPGQVALCRARVQSGLAPAN